MPTWTEAADWLEANVQTSLSEDRDRETAWDQARDECIQALRSKAAFDQRVEELRAAGTTLRRVITYEPERVRVQFIRDGVVQMEAAFGVVPEPPANASPLERARLIKEGWASWHAQCDFNAKSHKLPDRVHYVDEGRPPMPRARGSDALDSPDQAYVAAHVAAKGTDR